MTLVEAAEKIDIHYTHLVKIENRKRGLTMPMAQRIAKAWGVSVESVLGIEPGTSSTGLQVTVDAEPYKAEPGEFMPASTKKDEVERWRILRPVLSKRGIRAGAIVYVDCTLETVEKLPNLACVIAEHIQPDGTGVVIVRQYIEPSLLITNSHEENEPSIDLDKGEALIKGVIRGEYTPLF